MRAPSTTTTTTTHIQKFHLSTKQSALSTSRLLQSPATLNDQQVPVANRFLSHANSIPENILGRSRHLLDDNGTGTYDKKIEIEIQTKRAVHSTSRLQESLDTFKD